MQGAAAPQVQVVDVRAQLQDQTDRLERAVPGDASLGRHLAQPRRDHQRGVVLVGRGPGVRAGRREAPHDVDVGVHRGEQERGGAQQAHPEALAREAELGRVAAEPDVGVRPVGQQRVDEGELAGTQAVERAPLAVGAGIDAPQAAGQLRVPRPRRPVQGGVAGAVGVRVRPVLEQDHRQSAVAANDRDVQRRGAVRRRRVHVGPRRDEVADEGRIVLAGGNQQRREAALRSGLDLGAVLEQGPRRGRMSPARRPHEGGLAVPRLGRGGVGAVGQEHAHRLDRAGPGAGHDRRLSRAARPVRVGPRRQQPGHRRRGGVVARQTERRHPVVVGRVDGGAGPDEQVDELDRVVVRRPVQRRRAVGLDRVDVGAPADQRPRRFGVLRTHRRNQGAAVVVGRRRRRRRRRDEQARRQPAPRSRPPVRTHHRSSTPVESV